MPVSIAGGNISAGPSTATQTATSSANADVSNKAKTDQDQNLSQNIGGSGCYAGCGGAGGFQAGVQRANTQQLAVGIAKSDQNAVNANVPVSIAGGNVNSGPSSATQTATSTANADVKNKAKTDQDQTLSQNIGGSDSCKAGCGGAGGFQAGIQEAQTQQAAIGIAKSDQNAVNANVPVSIAGGNVSSGPSSATQTADSTANADVSNKAKTDQDQTLSQNIGGSGCYAGCGGPGGFQLGVQKADTKQLALGLAKSDQNAVNANVPVSIAGGNISAGPSTATQTATSSADADVKNKAKTDQDQSLSQNIGSGKDGKRPCSCDGKKDEPCAAGCGGAGGFQLGVCRWLTLAGGAWFRQERPERRQLERAAVGGRREHRQRPEHRDADGELVGPCRRLQQGQDRPGPVAPPGHRWLRLPRGLRRAGGFQAGIQLADTKQLALGFAKSDQNAVNGNAPHSVAGGNIADGPSTATQTATSRGDTDVKNKAKTDQNQWEHQLVRRTLRRAGGPRPGRGPPSYLRAIATSVGVVRPPGGGAGPSRRRWCPRARSSRGSA